MPKSYRIRTSVDGTNDSDKTIRVQIDQDFDFLEVLSLKLTQSDVYQRFCSDYGVVVGRVVANGGFGVPNAKVSVFVPLDEIDENDPVISTLYPYRSISDKNEDGFRYNLLPYKPSYDGHVATGTFPTREDVLTRKEVLKIYDKYYKYTVKTNESGDYMIVGVPLGNQKIFLDVDLSDMGCFSLRPTDLIRMGRATDIQFDGAQFRKSEDLESLPQIVTQTKTVSVSSFWGVQAQCDIGITRVDFDLRESNITIEPVATFMGSIMSSNKSTYLTKKCKPSSEQGDLCGMVAGPGKILAIRQTINTNEDGDPVLEQYQLPQGGKVIDENGAFVVDVPMNLDYVTTNEFGELTLSNDPKIGIPTKGKYRFKIKWENGEKELGTFQSTNSLIGPGILNLQGFTPKGELQVANFLVPNIKEYGWESSDIDPNRREKTSIENTSFKSFTFTNESLETQEDVLPSTNPQGDTLVLDRTEGQYESLSLYVKGPNPTDEFELRNKKWIEIPSGGALKVVVKKKRKSISFGSGTQTINSFRSVRLIFKQLSYDTALLQKSYSFSLDWDDYPDKEEAISCRDFFYEFNYNKVYTTAQLIDEYRYKKVKKSSSFLSIKEILDRSCDSEVNKFPINDGVRNFDLLFLVIQSLFQIIGVLAIILIPVYSLVKFLWNRFAVYIAAFFIAYSIYRLVTTIGVVAASINAGGPVLGSIYREGQELLTWTLFALLTTVFFKQITRLRLGAIKLPMITYPDCSSCDCGEYEVADGPPLGESNTSYLADINVPSSYQPYSSDAPFTQVLISQGYGQIAAGRDDSDSDSESDGARTPRFSFRNNNYWTSGKLKPDNTGNKDCSKEEKEQYTLPIPERVNLYNTKSHYFDNTSGGRSNRIKVYPNYTGNSVNSYYEDQPLVVLCDQGFLSTFSAGTMLSFISVNNTKDVNVSGSTTDKNLLGTRNVTGSTPSSGETLVTINYADPGNSDNPNPISKQFRIVQNLYSSGFTSYNFPADIEYYQIVTGYTLSQLDQIVNIFTVDPGYYNYSFYRRIIKGEMNVAWGFRDEENERVIGNTFCEGVGKQVAIDQIPKDVRENLVAVVMMKGVDPYSPRQRTKIDVSRIFGTKEGTMVAESNYKLNIPIQPDLNLKQHTDYTSNVGTQIFYPSYFFTPSTQTTTEKTWKYSAFTTNNHRLYSSYNGNKNVGNDRNGNQFLTAGIDGYYGFEYVGGGSEMTRIFFSTPVGFYLKKGKREGARSEDVGDSKYFRSVYTPTGRTLNMASNANVIMRTDRLPRSDVFDNNFVLAQNKAFAMYVVPDKGFSDVPLVAIGNSNDFSRGDSESFQEDYGNKVTSVLNSFSCDTIVPLGAYEQLEGQALRIKPKPNPVYYNGGIEAFPKIENGCYIVCDRELSLASDLEIFSEWKARYILGFALCRNVFGMTFTNQWVNGVLYMPGFQNDKIYPVRTLQTTNPRYEYCNDKIVFREENNSFFYRSSPWSQRDGKFIGKSSGQTDPKVGSNKYFLGNPTTIVDLGPKDNIIKYVCAKPEFQGYYMDKLEATTFNGVADLAQFFVISRMANAKFLQLMFSSKSGSVAQLFSRNGKKIDGDFAQLNSINSEIGVTPFSPETYKDTNLFYDGRPDPIMGVFFTAETTTRDYITPGREIFIDGPTKFAYNYFGIKSQIVPMYRWKLDKENVVDGKISIFGSEKNDWLTDKDKFAVVPYQGIDRLNDGTYYQSSIKNPTTQRPGYIYDSSGLTDSTGVITGYTFDGFADTNSPNEIMVGAPFHFYFGLKAGKTAYDIFIKKYLIDL